MLSADRHRSCFPLLCEALDSTCETCEEPAITTFETSHEALNMKRPADLNNPQQIAMTASES